VKNNQNKMSKWGKEAAFSPKWSRLPVALLILALLLSFSCERDISLLEPAGNPADGEVFIDGFSGGLDYSAFANSKLDAFDIDDEVTYEGTHSIRITVPYPEDPSGWFAGGAFYSTYARDLSGYNALTFWAKASKTSTVDVGFGNDNSGNSRFEVMQSGILLGTTWQKYIIPVPVPDSLTAERGMLHYAAGADANGIGGTIWFDEVQFEKVNTIAYPRIQFDNKNISGWVGREFDAGVSGVTFNIGGTDQTLSASQNYFSLESLTDSVAVITAAGKISAIGEGTAKILVRMGNVAADTLTLIVAEGNGPSVAAPTPELPAENVLSLFSDAYTDHPGTIWNTYWEYSTAQTEEMQIAGDNVKLYTDLNFVGIEFTDPLVNASEMTHFHLDFWTPNPIQGAFKIMLVDFGANGAYGGDDDASHELTFTAPTLVSQQWVSLDIPLSSFTGLTAKSNLAQLVLSGDISTVFIDNVYFHNAGDNNGGGGDDDETDAPETAAPTPGYSAADVISIFSDAYTNLDGTNFYADWGQSTMVSEVAISGNNTLKYGGLNYQGIELASSQDLSGMSHLRLDVWSANSTAFNVWLISTGPVEKDYAITVPTSGWSTLEIDLSTFSPVALNDVIQLKFDGNGDIFLDNILFFKEDNGGGGESSGHPTEPAPTPDEDAANVISLFSNAYSNVTVDTWSADWDQADLADTVISGNNLKKYYNMFHCGIEFTSQTINAANMSYFHFDIWTPDADTFMVKLVDFGANGVWNGGDDVEHELVYTADSNPALEKGQWISFDIPLSDFSGMTTKEHLAQLIFSARNNTVYIDNIYFYGEGGGSGATEPTSAAPTPTYPAGDVISLFSNAYTNVTVDTWSADWDQADLAELQIAGNDVKRYTNVVFTGTEFTSQPVNGGEMTHFRMDLWTPDATDAPKVFKIKLVDFGANGTYDGGDDVEHELSLTASSTPAIATGQWVTLDIPLTEFTGLTTKEALAQLIFSGDLSTFYIDNVLFHK
jgi:hypothetical protein